MPGVDVTVTVGDHVEPETDERNKRIYVTVNAVVFSFNQALSRYQRLRELLREYDGQATKLGDGQAGFDIGYAKRNEIVGLA